MKVDLNLVFRGVVVYAILLVLPVEVLGAFNLHDFSAEPYSPSDNQAYANTPVYVLDDPEDLIREKELPTTPVLAGPNDIMVSVFQDFNGDGARNAATEPLISGLTVTAYDGSNNQVAQDNVGSGGNYLLNVGGGTGLHRVEVTGLPSNLQPGAVGSSTVFFAQANQTVLVAVADPDRYSQDNPDLITTCFIEGPQPSGSGETLIRFGYDAGCFDQGVNGSCNDGGSFNDTKTPLANAPDIGSTYGVAYQRDSRSAFVASFMKRHTGFKENGKTGVIYRVQNPLSNSPTITEYIDFDALGIPTQPASGDPHPADGAAVNLWERDSDSWDWVGKMSFGDLDISEDEETLYVVNMFDRRLYYFPAKATPYTAGDANLVQSIPLPSPCGNAIDFRPFGLGVHKGKVYIGTVCSGEASTGNWAGGPLPNENTRSNVNTLPPGDRNALSADVLEWDPSTPMTAPTSVLNFDLDYGRGFSINSGNSPNSAIWNPWVTEWTVFNRLQSNGFYPQDRAYPQPMLSDIEFDGDNMVLGMRDRFGDQSGHLQRPPAGFNVNVGGSNEGLYSGVAQGDLLKACGDPTNGWTLESGGSCGGVASQAITPPNSNGPGGGEFFAHDDYDNFHNEINHGGLVIVPGQEEVATIMTDPINSRTTFYDAGVIWYNNATGRRVQNFLVFSTADDVGDDDGPTFAKANGLGDMVALSDPTPIQVGNRVWIDDGDGIQEPGEAGINGVLVELYKIDGSTRTKVAETTTASDAVQGDGAYKFSNSSEQSWQGGETEMLPNMDYEVVVSLTDGALQGAGISGYSPSNSTSNATNNNKTDLSDSDAIVDPNDSNLGVIAFSTGERGENNHTLDIGVLDTPPCSIDGSIIATNCDGKGTPNTGDDDYTFTVSATVTNGNGQYDVLVNGSVVATNINSGAQTDIVVLANAGNTVDISFQNAGDPTCVSSDITSPVLDPCSPPGCTIDGSIVSTDCDGQETSNTSDDEYTFTVTATVANGSGAYNVLVNGSVEVSNVTSGDQTDFTVSANAGNTIDISFQDFVDPTCVSSVITSPVLDPCSPAPCTITVDAAVPTACVPATSTYSLLVTVTFTNAPVGEMLNITTTEGANMSFTPTSANGTESYTLSNLPANGAPAVSVTATFGGGTGCTDTATDAYAAPPACVGCPDGNCGSTTVRRNN